MKTYFKEIFDVIDLSWRVKLLILIILSIFISMLEALVIGSIVSGVSSWKSDKISSINIFSYPLTLEIFIVVLITALFMISVLRMFTQYYNLYTANEIIKDLSCKVYIKVLATGYEGIIKDNNSNELATTLSVRMSSIGSKGIFQFTTIIINSIVLGTILIYGFYILDNSITSTFVFLFMVFALLGFFTGKLHKGLSDKINTGLGESLSSVFEVLKKAKDIFAFKAEQKFKNKFFLAQKKLSFARTWSNFIGISSRSTVEIIVYVLGIILGTLFPEILVSNLDMIFIGLVFAQRLLPYCQSVFAAWTVLNTNKIEVLTAIKLYQKMNNFSDGVSKSLFKVKRLSLAKAPLVKTKDISIKIDKNNFINLPDITVHKEEWIGISSESGTGKTTLLDIIMGLRKATYGTIFFNKNSSKNKLITNNVFAYVPQSPALFGETLLEALTLRSSLYKKEIDKINLLFDLCRVDFVSEKDLKLPIKNFSGGQIKRLALVRAMYQNPKLLILDEFGAGLSDMMTSKILTNLKHFKIACLIVSHTKSDFKLCKEVIYID